MKTYFLLLIISVVFAILWRDYKKYLLIKYRYRFFALRDNLRQAVIDGNVDKDNWLFDYMDYSISCTIKQLPYINLWWAIMLYFKHKNDVSFNNFRNSVDVELKNNAFLSDLYKNYGKILTQYIVKNHTVTYILSKIGAMPVFVSYYAIKSLCDIANTSIKNLRSYPETSASGCYI